LVFDGSSINFTALRKKFDNYLGVAVEVGDSGRFIISVLQYRRAITIDLLSWFYIRGG
jgi:hypothetical protein